MENNNVQTKVTSGLFKLDWADLGKGLIVAVASAVITVIKQSLDAGNLHFDWKNIGIVAGTAGIAYLSKNLLTPTQTIVKILVLIAGLFMINLSAEAQSMFSRLPVPAFRQHVLSLQVFGDSVMPSLAAPTMKAFRFVTNVLTYSEPDHVLMGGAGVAYQRLHLDATTQKWYSDYSINALVYGGAGVSPPNAAAVSAGLSLGFLNNLITVGGAYNFESKKFGPTLGININLNN